MPDPAGKRDSRSVSAPVIVPPKPRSMQSRFILMETASVALALTLLGGVLGLSFLIRSRIVQEISALQQRLSIHTHIFVTYDRMLFDFWRAFPPPGPKGSITSYRADTEKLHSLIAQFSESAATSDEADEASRLQQNLEPFLTMTDGLLAGQQTKQQVAAGEEQVMAKTESMGKIFQATSAEEFDRLWSANRKLDVYNRALYFLLIILGVYPIGVMAWFRRAQERNLWSPLEQLYGMVMEVKRGNLNVKGDIPDTVELGTLTAAFLSMAEELGEMRHSLEEKVHTRAAQLEAANRDLLRAAKLAALGQLVSGVAHEINNPLTSILGFSEVLLSRQGLDAGLRSQLQTIRNEAVRLKHLVANLSTFSRGAPQNFSNIDLRTVPDRLLQLRSYQLAANNIKISYGRPEKPVWVNADGEQLLEVLLQLVLNSEQAIRAVSEKGEIRISCEAQDGKAILTVTDDGCGMREEIRDQIFDPFFTTKPGGRGTGLGLSISHKIVVQHNGQLHIESATGCGTEVRISLPLVENGEGRATTQSSDGQRGEAAATSKTLEEASLPPRAKKASRAIEEASILAIDDEAEILSLVSFVLGKAGAEVVTLQDPAKLDSVLDRKHFDAVLCDLKMPGRDGLTILRWLREKRPELAGRFVLMTGNLADAEKAGLELENIPIIPKPFSLVRLREALGEILAAGS